MATVRVSFSISLDGYGAGPSQSREDPLGVGGEALHEWAVATRAWRAMHGLDGGGGDPTDERFLARAADGVGATIMGRNMFGPIRGPWDEPWEGWWGEEPPFHHPVFVLTHYPREPLALTGTTFHFVTDGIEAALSRASDAAGERDVAIGGGPATIRQFLDAGLVDEIHLAVAPVLLGSGERLLGDLDGMPAYERAEVAATSVGHYRLVRKA